MREHCTTAPTTNSPWQGPFDTNRRRFVRQRTLPRAGDDVSLTSRTSDSADAQKRLSREWEKYVNILLTVHLFHHFLCVRCATRAWLVSFSARGESFDTMRARKQQSMTSACSECPSDDVTLSANNSASALEMPRLQMKARKKQDVARELSDLVVYTQAVKFRGFYAGCTSVGGGLSSNNTAAPSTGRARVTSSARSATHRKASSVLLHNTAAVSYHQGSYHATI